MRRKILTIFSCTTQESRRDSENTAKCSQWPHLYKSYENGINVLSLLDGAGASCEVLKRLQIKVKKVFAVEKNDKSRKVAKHNHGRLCVQLVRDNLYQTLVFRVTSILDVHIVLSCTAR